MPLDFEPKRNLYLNMEIDDNVAGYIIGGIEFYNYMDSFKPINLIINSPGGVVTAGNAIIDCMKLSKAPINTIVIGQAASMAALIASFGKKRFVSERARIMIHDVIGGTAGNIENIKDDVEEMKRISERLIIDLSINTGKPVSVIREDIFKKDLYLNAAQAVVYGLADNVMDKDFAEQIRLSEKFNTECSEIKSDTEIPLLKTGVFNTSYGRIEVNEEMIDAFIKNFDDKVRGQDISIDYTHDNDTGENPAAFWIKSLEKRNEGNDSFNMVAIGECTPDGKKLIGEKAYKYASAEFVMNYDTQDDQTVPFVLLGGTLTNRPQIKNDPIKLSEKMNKKDSKKGIVKMEVKNLKTDELTAELSTRGVNVPELQATIADQTKALDTNKEVIKGYKAQLDEVTAKGISEAKAVAFNELLTVGKVVKAQETQIIKQFSDAVTMKAFYKDAPIVNKVLPEGDNGADSKANDPVVAALIDKGIINKEDVEKYL